jgi:hypothetical protein
MTLRDVLSACCGMILNERSAEIYFNRWQLYAATLRRLS